MQTVLYHATDDLLWINDVTQQLQNGAIGIFPTDTVYGIGCNALNLNSLQNLYRIKQRDLNKPINILVSNRNMVQKFVTKIHPLEKLLIENFWPGALTIIFQKSSIVPDLLTSGLDTIGIRMPNHKVCLQIIEQFGSPLAMSSANISEQAPNEDLHSLLLNFAQKVDFMIDNGRIANGIPSTIVQVVNNEIKIVREGSITAKDIEAQLGGK